MNYMKVIAIDPGNIQSALCIIDIETLKPLEFVKADNAEIKEILLARAGEDSLVAIEMIASYGMAVGRDVFDTAVWIGRFFEVACSKTITDPDLVYRMEEKNHICHSSKANDSTIRRALIDRFAKHDLKNGKGTKKNPDWFYGFKADIWAAYAVGLTYIETHMIKQEENHNE